MQPSINRNILAALVCGLVLGLTQPTWAGQDDNGRDPSLKRPAKEQRQDHDKDKPRQNRDVMKSANTDRDGREDQQTSQEGTHKPTAIVEKLQGSNDGRTAPMGPSDDVVDRKATQERKELGRGSDQGQESRETHSRKWWKFWE